MTRFDTIILYSDQRDQQYVARSSWPLTQAEWSQALQKSVERWRQLNLFLGKGRQLPIPMQEGELEAFDNGTVGMFRWMYEEKGLDGLSITVTPKPVIRLCYDAYAAPYKKP